MSAVARAIAASTAAPVNAGCAPAERRRLALVIWNGTVGGAESVEVELARHLRERGVEVTTVFAGDPEPLAGRLRDHGLPYRTLGLARGRMLAAHARGYARLVSEVGPDGALLEERGLMALALRAGGYRCPVVATEHGSLLIDERLRPGAKRALRSASRALGARAVDAEVAVSEFMLARLRAGTHARRTLRIYNGIDPELYASRQPEPAARTTVGFAGRLVAGKGLEELIAACALAAEQSPLELLIAGEGPQRERISEMCGLLRAPSRATLLGYVEDMPGFWERCEIAVIPSSRFVESFSMVTLEAMASGRAIVATQNGAIGELMRDGHTGTLVAPGDAQAMAQALMSYLGSRSLRASHGAAARRRAVEQFHIARTAACYLALFGELRRARQGR